MNNYQNVSQFTFTPEALSLAGEARLAYIRKVYSYFGLAIAAAIGGTLLSMNTGLVGFFGTSPFIGLILFLGAVFLASRSAENPVTALPTLIGATFVSGLVMSPTI